MAASKGDELDELEVEMPAWSAECSRDAVLAAWATLTAAAMIERRLYQIERSLDLIANEMPNAGAGT